MQNHMKYDQILDAFQKLLVSKNMKTISVSEIAQSAGIGKGSIYYYFPSKEAILDALIERSYKKPLETARQLTEQTDISPFTRMALIFQACRDSSREFMHPDKDEVQNDIKESDIKEHAFLHHKYLTHLIMGLKPPLTEIIRQGSMSGEIHFEHPAALAEIVLIVLTVKLDNTLVPSSQTEVEDTILGLIELLEKGTDNPKGSLNFLKIL